MPPPVPAEGNSRHSRQPRTTANAEQRIVLDGPQRAIEFLLDRAGLGRRQRVARTLDLREQIRKESDRKW